MTARHAYIDGSNNVYEIGELLEYKPITPAQSSTGMYSGGEPKSVALDAEQRAELIALFDRIIADTANILAQRPKGCGTLVVGDTRTFVSGRSPLKIELEQRLRGLLSDGERSR